MKTLVRHGVISAALLIATSQAQELSLTADKAVLSGPIKLTNGCLCQPLTTSMANGGRALFAFNITNAGSYVVRVTVNAQNAQPHSIGINIDAEPKEPEMIWDVGATSGFEPQLVAWRGNGTTTTTQSKPQVFALSQGTHQLFVREMDPNTQVQRLSLLQLPAPPTGLHIVVGQ
jgi:hypothetical protein